jgi:hypothetical protein
MPRAVKPTGRSLALVLAAVVLLGACTGSGGGDKGNAGNGGTGNGGTAGTGPAGETAVTPVGVTGASTTSATYEYRNAGLDVTMKIDGTSGTLEVDNGTDHEVGKPGFYLLDARTGAQTDGHVQAGETLAPGDSGTYDVSFSGLEIRNIGLVVLLLGRDNYGAFVRTA